MTGEFDEKYIGVFNQEFILSGFLKKEVKEKSLFKAKSYLKRFYILNFTKCTLTI